MSATRVIALLGRRDAPTDALDEYCTYLGAALQARGFALELVRVPWFEQGWSRSLGELRRRAREWKGDWVFVQYTALSWSARGFPLRFSTVLRALRGRGARVGVVFHDAGPYAGSRVVDRVRRRIQLRAMRGAVASASLCVFTVPLASVTWNAPAAANAAFIPVGANFPSADVSPAHTDSVPTVAVYGITGGRAGEREKDIIIRAMRGVAVRMGRVRLLAFGRHADVHKDALESGLAGANVEVDVRGLLPPDEVRRALAASDALLFVRGTISSRRGSAIAGIACGLPVVAFAGSETAHPITDAGVVLADASRPGAVGEALLRVLTDAPYRESLREHSRRAQREHFSWAAIAARYAEEIRKRS